MCACLGWQRSADRPWQLTWILSLHDMVLGTACTCFLVGVETGGGRANFPTELARIFPLARVLAALVGALGPGEPEPPCWVGGGQGAGGCGAQQQQPRTRSRAAPPTHRQLLLLVVLDEDTHAIALRALRAHRAHVLGGRRRARCGAALLHACPPLTPSPSSSSS